MLFNLKCTVDKFDYFKCNLVTWSKAYLSLHWYGSMVDMKANTKHYKSMQTGHVTLSLLIGNFCCLLITFENSQDLDQDQPDLDPSRVWKCFWKNFLKTFILKKVSRRQSMRGVYKDIFLLWLNNSMWKYFHKPVYF